MTGKLIGSSESYYSGYPGNQNSGCTSVLDVVFGAVC